MKLPIFQVDAFCSRVFAGNPACVVPLAEWLPDATLQAIAAENNVAETAFYIPSENASEVDFDLRWFTPTVEVALCGHATLATGHVLMRHLDYKKSKIRFSSKSGVLEVTGNGTQLALDFPSRPPTAIAISDALCAALGARPDEVLAARDWVAVFPSESAVRALRPDFAKVAELDTFGVIVTAAGDEVDFVSRFFVPSAGINEDPVTGSAHCSLIPYWARRLSKSAFFARQVSARGGELHCRLLGDRVRIAGEAVTYLEGTISV